MPENNAEIEHRIKGNTQETLKTLLNSLEPLVQKTIKKDSSVVKYSIKLGIKNL